MAVAVAVRIPSWGWRYLSESQREQGRKVFVLSHTWVCWLQLPLLYIKSELTVFSLDGKQLLPLLTPPLPPVMSTGRDFTLKRDSSGNEENVEFGWKIPNGFWVKQFLPFCLVGKVTSPTAPLKLRGSPCWGHVRQPAARGAAESHREHEMRFIINPGGHLEQLAVQF